MPEINVTIPMDASLKKQAEALFNDLGMSLATAITVFTKQAIREQKIPFDIAKSSENNRELCRPLSHENEISDENESSKYCLFDDLLEEMNLK